MESAEFDLDKICRVCKGETDFMRSVFENDENTVNSPRIDEMLMACASVTISLDDRLPKLICQHCSEHLSKAYSFKYRCERTDTILREYLRVIHNTSCGEDVKQTCLERSGNFDRKHNLNAELESALRVVLKADPDELHTDADERQYVDESDYIQVLENNQIILTCRSCDRTFATVDGLRCHKRLHTGELFECKECDKKFTKQIHLHRHEVSHGRRKIHVCRICNKTLTRFEHLRRHLITHVKDKPFSCTTCNRTFNRQEHLESHLSRCKGMHVFVCDVCNKGFNRKDSLEVHRRMHENQMPVLPTLENLDNIDQHYVEIEYDGSEDNIGLGAHSDVSGSDDGEDEGDFFGDSMKSNIILEEEEEAVIHDEETPMYEDVLDENDDTLAVKEDEITYKEVIREDTEVELPAGTEIVDELSGDTDIKDDGEESDSNASEYIPTRPYKTRRKRGRPRKNPIGGKTTGRRRGRPRKNKLKVESDEDDLLGEFKCSVCEQIFGQVSLLDMHVTEHEGLVMFVCMICDKQVSYGKNMRAHMLTHSESKPHSCTVCNKRFSRYENLIQHMRLHESSHSLECEVCKRQFLRADKLIKHLASKHNIGEKIVNEKKYQCSVCLKSFTTEKYREVHMKNHSGDRSYQCRTCDKTFVSKSHLSEHVKFHSDNSKKYLCSECGQRFIRNDYLVIHMRRHRGEKPFKCKFCGKGFPRTTDLTVHERYHTGEKTHLCMICGRGFGRAYNLTVHMRTHTGEKPYQCTYCEAAFAQGNDLKAHVRRHTGERFHCEFCSESFLMGYLLTQHKRNIHGMNVVSNIRRLQPVTKTEDMPGTPVTIPLPQPTVPDGYKPDIIRSPNCVTIK